VVDMMILSASQLKLGKISIEEVRVEAFKKGRLIYRRE
jgi:hypothetical protein